MHTGSCLCGGVRYRIASELQPIQVCHCRQCRKAQGGPFATNIPVPASDFVIIEGRDLLKEFASPTRPGKVRVFCARCGSPIISRLDSKPGTVRVRAGTIDGPIPDKVAFHAFVAHQANWWPIEDDRPRYDEFAPG